MLDHLAQLVQLHRGQAATIHHYLVHVQLQLLVRDPHKRGQQLSAAQALSLKPLAGLIKRLKRLIGRDQLPPPKGKPRPHGLKVAYDEMTTVRLYYGAMLASAAHCPYAHAELATVLGKFHQPSLNLEQHITMPPPSGPGCQTSLL